MKEEPNIQNRLRELRRQHDLSQEELAEALGISRQSVIALEQGKYMPSLPLVVSMCNFFNSAFEEIFDFEKEINQMFENNSPIKIINHNPATAGQLGQIEDERLLGRLDEVGKPLDRLDEVGKPLDRLDEVGKPLDRLGVKENSMPREIGPWRPFGEMVTLRDAMDRLFEESVVTPAKAGGMPKINVKETKDAVIVKAELPGVAEEDVTVEVADNIMTISGEKKEEKEEKDEGFYHKEMYTGSFTRSFTLPSEVKSEKAEAEMDNGILTITVPKVAPKQAAKIAVKKKAKK
ncbi:MAG: Hsp20 family protein [Patescibacteria group bacterium]|jgi:HSP20 family protein